MQPEAPLPVDDESLQAYYAQGKEADRLATGLGRVEYLRTVEVLERILPDAAAVIADIGGGPGIYADHLLSLGHRVVHRDLVADHVEAIRARHQPGTETGDRLDAAIGDARHLDIADDSVDVVLLLGPLYHLPDPGDRRAAIREADRIVRRGGAIVAAAINRHSVLLDGLLMKRADLVHPQIYGLLDEVRETGIIPPLFEGGFNGYAHTAEQLRDEVTQADLTVEQLISVEGVSFALGDVDARLDDPDERERLLHVLRTCESEPDLIGAGPHILAVARSTD